MNTLAILAEDDSDEIFYEACAERITGLSFEKVDSLRIRKNGGISAVRTALPAFLNDLKGLSQMGNAYFIIALDNDRAPEHPDHTKIEGLSRRDRSQRCRFCKLNSAITEVFGHDQNRWPAKGAIAVPVQMLESWILLAIEPSRGELPLFSRKNSSSARVFYSGAPPDQLKDLCKAAKNEVGIESNSEFFLDVAGRLEIEEVCVESPSFQSFKEQLDSWS